MAAAEQDHPFADWMRDEAAACSKLDPFQFCFPGAHDSASSRMTGGPVQLAEGASRKKAILNAILNVIVKLPCLRKLVGRWTLTHPRQSIYDQLLSGIRFLDLRVSKSDKNQVGEHVDTYILVHTFGVGYLEEALGDIARFVAGHPGELVLIAFVPSQDKMDQDAMKHYVEGYLGKHVCPADTLQPSGPGEVPSVKAITDAGHNIVLLGSPSGDGGVWTRKDKLTSGPGDFQSIIDVNEKTALNHQMLGAYLDSTPKSQQRTDLFQLAHTVTPGAKSIVKDLFLCRSLVDHADAMNAVLVDFVASSLSEQEKDAVNIITVDNQQHSDVVSVARQLLHARLPRIQAQPATGS